MLIKNVYSILATRSNWREPRGFDRDYHDRGRFDDRPSYERSFSTGSRNRYKSSGSHDDEGKYCKYCSYHTHLVCRKDQSCLLKEFVNRFRPVI